LGVSLLLHLLIERLIGALELKSREALRWGRNRGGALRQRPAASYATSARSARVSIELRHALSIDRICGGVVIAFVVNLLRVFCHN
jgi:hypothetical protein